ncbi:glycerophosphodiester phosphodiesterase [Lacipirellula sp.]|uniref:glycerophosphodiester phosphodiesterase n=1 Tax=Lacipirellula sp. TaxID=2691419 RepID=UPI003D09C04E
MQLRRFIFTLTLAFLATTTGSAADQEGKLGFHIQAHRGAGIKAPENTLEAFESMWDVGVTPEADLRTTKDGVIVCFHDADFSRVVGNVDKARAGQGVEDLTAAEVKQLEVGSFRGKQYAGQRIPTLADLFAAMQGHPDWLVYLDIKTENVDLDQLQKQVVDASLQKQIIFTTKHHDLIRKWKQRVPESLTLIWNGGTEAELKQRLDDIRAKDFEGLTHLQIHVKVIGDPADAEPFVPSIAFLESVRDELKARGIVFQVLPWENADPAVYTRLLELGAESFATDYPDVTVDAVKKFKSR